MTVPRSLGSAEYPKVFGTAIPEEDDDDDDELLELELLELELLELLDELLEDELPGCWYVVPPHAAISAHTLTTNSVWSLIIFISLT